LTDCKIFLERNLPEGGEFPVRDDFAEHYLVTVRRLSPGDRLVVAGTNRVAEATLRSDDPLTVEVDSVRPAQPLDWDLRVHQAITRKKKFEETIKWGTELGVTQFVPVITDRTVRVPNNPEKQRRRWRKIATDSARISERDTLPAIREPQPLDDVLSSTEGRMYRADPGGETMEKVVEREDNTPDSVALVVGPEGGFTEDEEDRVDAVATGTVRAGTRNLRAETASVTLVGLWLSEKGYL